jgi:hypothetical protein
MRLYPLYHALELWDWFSLVGQTEHLTEIPNDIAQLTRWTPTRTPVACRDRQTDTTPLLHFDDRSRNADTTWARYPFRRRGILSAPSLLVIPSRRRE